MNTRKRTRQDVRVLFCVAINAPEPIGLTPSNLIGGNLGVFCTGRWVYSKNVVGVKLH